jgi:hypothetical protein
MPRAKANTKTATMTLRVSPTVKAAARRAAEHDRRSVTNLVEVLILDHCKTLNIPVETNASRETSR